MAYRKEYYVRSKYYSCFAKGEKTTTKYFDTISRAWEYYKEEHASDFNYGDAWHETEPVQFRWINDTERTEKLGHVPCKCGIVTKIAREIHQMFDDDEINHLLNIGEDEPKSWLIFDDDDLDEDPIM